MKFTLNCITALTLWFIVPGCVFANSISVITKGATGKAGFFAGICMDKSACKEHLDTPHWLILFVRVQANTIHGEMEVKVSGHDERISAGFDPQMPGEGDQLIAIYATTEIEDILITDITDRLVDSVKEKFPNSGFSNRRVIKLQKCGNFQNKNTRSPFLTAAVSHLGLDEGKVRSLSFYQFPDVGEKGGLLCEPKIS